METPIVEIERAMTQGEIAAMIGTNGRESFAEWQTYYEGRLAERDATIAQLEAQVRALEAKTSRPVVRETPANVQALPVLTPDARGRALCPVNPEHGVVAVNVRHRCPKCHTAAVFANSPAGKTAMLAEAQA